MNKKHLYPMYNRSHSGAEQQGATLAIVLIFLVLVTLVGVTGMTTTTLEEKMAGNLKDQNLAFQAAESGLRDAKLDISGGVVPGAATTLARNPVLSGATGFGDNASNFPSCSANTPPDITAGLCLSTYEPFKNAAGISLASLNSTQILNQNFLTAPSVEYGSFTGAARIDNVFMQPRYLIEAVKVCEGGGKCPSWMYRITARGYGARFESQVTLQEIVRVP